MKRGFIIVGVITLLLVSLVRLELAGNESGDASKPSSVPRKDADANTLAKGQAVVDAAQSAYRLKREGHRVGLAGQDAVYVWSRRWLDAERSFIAIRWNGNDAEIQSRTAQALQEHETRMRALHAGAKTRHEVGEGGMASLASAKFYLAEADLWTAQFKAGSRD